MADITAQYEYHRMQFMGNLNDVAALLRRTAESAEQLNKVMAQAGPGLVINGGTNNVNNGHQAAAAAGRSKRKAEVLEDEADGKKKTRKKREPRDPDAPKRPASSYILYQNEVRKDIKEKNPGLSNSEILAIIGKKWASLSDADKARYNVANSEAKAKYLTDKAAYDAKQSTDAESPVQSEPPPPPPPAKKAKAAPAPAPAPAPPKSAPVVAETSSSESSDESETGEEESSVDEDEEEEEEQTPVPAPVVAKTKKAAAPTPAKSSKRVKG